jgi:hypothetical protein
MDKWIEECGSEWNFIPIWEMSPSEIDDERITLHAVISLMKELELKVYRGFGIEDLEERLNGLWVNSFHPLAERK